jgi:hypothetical protein
MKNIIFILILATYACQNSTEKKADCSEFNFFNQTRHKPANPSPIDYKVYIDSNYESKIIKLEDVDTLYQFRNRDGWSNFDYLCSLYKKNDSAQYQIQLLRSEYREKFYTITTKTVDTSDWVKFSHKIISSNFWCYPALQDNCVDCGDVHFLVQEKNRKSKVSFNSHFQSKEKDRLQNLALDLLTLADNNLFKIDFYSQTKGDSIVLNMTPTPYLLLHCLDSAYFKTPFSTKKLFNKDWGTFTIHKRDSVKINEIQLIVKMRNGKTIMTTEHVKKQWL